MLARFSFYIYALVLCIVIHLIYIKSVSPKSSWFNVTTTTTSINPDSLFISESSLIPEPHFLLASHSATFTVMNNDDLLAFWFAGSHEGKPDVKIWSSKYESGHWTMATPVVSPEYLSHKLGFYVRKLGNPVVYRDVTHNILHLFVVSVGAIGGWAGSHINHLISEDDGKTWGKPERLVLTPLFNISTLDRTLAIPLKDGGFYLPVYHEMINTYPELLRFNESGIFVSQLRMSTAVGLLQPAIVPLTENIADGFMRNHSKHNDTLYMQKTINAGRAWSEPIATNLQNHDSSIAVAVLKNQTRIMVHNVGTDRSKLVLSKSNDGVTWQNVMVLENEAKQEFSYPVIIVHNGVIDLLYTWKRKQIKHVRLMQRV